MRPPVYKKIANQHILYDPEMIPRIDSTLFEPGLLKEGGKPIEAPGGRGSAFFVSDGRHNYLLRHYMRGGIIARFARDHYFWFGLRKTRAWQEWYLLSEMHQQGLAVPKPVAARVIAKGWRYSADLVTLVLENCHSLAGNLKCGRLSDKMLKAVGQCIRHFHDAKIDHADLNAHNILINEKGSVYLIDFDQGRRRSNAGIWKKKNLNRLHRSLSKLAMESERKVFDPEKWEMILRGYRASS